MSDGDRARFVHDIYEFNDTAPARDTYRTMWEIRSPTLSRKRDMIVDVHGWCLMDNHYHLLVSERQEGGLSLFARRLNVGYAMYFNEKHKRSGVLFQGRTKKVRIDNDAHFLHILHYTHLNPLDFLAGATGWRDGWIENLSRALAHLDEYRWSSFSDYCGKKNFPSVINKELFGGVFKDYRKALSGYLKDLEPSADKSGFLE